LYVHGHAQLVEDQHFEILSLSHT